jgi:hypothetical protein
MRPHPLVIISVILAAIAAFLFFVAAGTTVATGTPKTLDYGLACLAGSVGFLGLALAYMGLGRRVGP